MNGGTHALVGAAAGASVYCIAAKALGIEPTWGGAAVPGLLGAGAAVLPDILEPALHPRHRALFHSVGFNGAMAYGVRRL